MVKQSFSGGCQCGQVEYEITREKLGSYICHCEECKKQSASAFAISVPVHLSELSLTGSLNSYDRPAHSGAITHCWFCSSCGTRIYHQSSSSNGLITLKGGTLDCAGELEPVAHLWTLRKHSWIQLPADIETFERQPADLSAWRNQLLEESE